MSDGSTIKVQGTYELRTCSILDVLLSKGEIKFWEKTKDRIKYIGFDNENHSYLLDFKFIDKSNVVNYIEVKGYIRKNDPLKWKAAIEQGLNLNVWFLCDIEEKESEINETFDA